MPKHAMSSCTSAPMYAVGALGSAGARVDGVQYMETLQCAVADAVEHGHDLATVFFRPPNRRIVDALMETTRRLPRTTPCCDAPVSFSWTGTRTPAITFSRGCPSATGGQHGAILPFRHCVTHSVLCWPPTCATQGGSCTGTCVAAQLAGHATPYTAFEVRVYVISMARRKDRLRRILSGLAAAAGTDHFHHVHIVAAVDGGVPGALDGVSAYDGWCQPSSSNAYYARPVTRGEMGCTLSHLKALEAVVRSTTTTTTTNAEHGDVLPLHGARAVHVVLEDDAIVPADFFDAVLAVHSAAACCRPHDVVFLGHQELRVPQAPVCCTASALRSGISRCGYSYQTHAYVVSPGGAEKIARAAAKVRANTIAMDELVHALAWQHPRGTELHGLYVPYDARVHLFKTDAKAVTQGDFGHDTEM